MLKRVLSWLLPAPPTPEKASPKPKLRAVPAVTPGPLVPAYPPVDQGLPVLSIEDLLASQADLITRITHASGLPPADLDKYLMPVIRNYAGYVHLLPATRETHHRGAGGLFRLGLETAFYALQASMGVIYAGLEATERKRIVEVRWRFAAFVAGLSIDTFRALNDLVVVDDQDREWPAYQRPLFEWLKDGGAQRYFVRWVSPPQVGASEFSANSYILGRLLPEESAQYLREGGNVVLATLIAVITGAVVPGEPVTLNQVVLQMRRRVIDRDAGVQPELYGRLTVGTHLESHLIDAMRRLIRNGTWKVNERKSRLWYGGDGLFLVWKTAANEILALLKEDKVDGIPQDRDTLCDLLVRAKVIEADEQGNPYRTIETPLSDNSLAAVKIAAPDLLFHDLEDVPAAITQVLETRRRAEEQQREEQRRREEQERAAAAAREAAARAASGPPGVPGLPPVPAPAADAPAADDNPARRNHRRVAVDDQNGGGESRQQSSAPTGDEVQLGTGVERILSQLPELAQEVTRAIIDDLTQRRVPEEIFFSRELNTIVIAAPQLNAYGVDLDQILTAWSRAGWLYVDPENANRKVHKVRRGGGQKDVFALKPEIADALGLIRRQQQA